ncbi:MAG TPA: ABC transporter permease [Candidatus Sulfotelmatobacter sp.]|nr:ABC transporter permease [Candidatus Sulfotelmatobacter sp.]
MNLRSTLQRLLNLFRNRAADDHDLHAELHSHLQLHIDDNLAQGMTPEQARRDALLKLGGLEQTKERVRDQSILPWLASLWGDVIFGYRQLSKNKITSLAAILSLALAIGSCTAAFRLIDAILLRPLPVANADHLYFLSRSAIDPQGKPQDFDGWAYPDFQLMRDAAKGQAQLFAVSYEDRSDLTYSSDQEMEKAYINYVSGDMFSAFGLKPVLGRLLTPADDSTPGGHPVAVISYDYWTRRFQRDPAVLGKTFRIGNTLFQIVGVCNPPFTGTEPGTMIEMFLPTMMHPAAVRKDSTWHRIFALVSPGVAIEPLRAKLDSISRAFETERSKSWTNESPEEIARELDQTLHFHSASSGASGFQQDNRIALLTLGALVFFVLLIACANVANLLVAQAAARSREMALRISIGAGRRHLLQLVLVQSAILAVVASALGALFASWSAPFVLSTINPSDNPVRLALPADHRVFLFLILLTAVVTCLFGVLPALRASSIQPASALKGGENPHSRRRLMYVLIGAQVAFCCLVLFVAGLFVSTFQRLSHQPVGFSTDRLLILDTVTREPVAPATWLQLADQLRSTPGVERISVSNGALLSGFSNNDEISINSGPPGNLTYFRNVSPGWLETLQIPLIYGRDFLPSEITPVAREGTAASLNGAAVVNQTFARNFFHEDNVVGKSFDELLPYGRVHFLIVGVARDAKYLNIRENTLPTAYLPFLSPDPKAWWSADGATFIVRTSSTNPLALATTMRRAITQLRSDFRVSDVHTQTELIDRQTIRERLLATLASFFSLVALLLAAVGLYGVLHYSVQQRRREIAIRMAIGAQAPSIAKLVSLPLFATVAAGATLGILAGLFSSRYLSDIFYQVRPTDAPMLSIPILAIAAAALLSSLPATLRAIHTDPASTLKAE